MPNKCKCPKCGYSQTYPKASLEFEIIEIPTSSPYAFELKIKCPRCGCTW